jgi:hypothetical protein
MLRLVMDLTNIYSFSIPKIKKTHKWVRASAWGFSPDIHFDGFDPTEPLEFFLLDESWLYPAIVLRSWNYRIPAQATNMVINRE